MAKVTGSPATRLHVYRVGSEMFATAVKWAIAPSNPFAAVDPPRR
jgi:hypothetical protein